MKTRLTNFLNDKTGVFKLAFLTSPLFIFGLVAKLYAAALFGGTNFVTLFIPFLKYLSLSGNDPYSYFYSLKLLISFPYPELMLYIMALPGLIFPFLLSSDIFSVNNGELLLFHLPILIADITILVVLSRWLKNKHQELLWFYWLSPILFYINYLHSQLDVIPIALTFVFLYLLFKERWVYALIFLGAAIATKFHIVLILPFTIIYLWRKRLSPLLITAYTTVCIATFLTINNVQLFSKDFLTIVFGNQEQGKIFDLFIPLGNGHFIYLIPVAYILLFIHALTFKRLNRDTFVMFLGFSFGILTLGIPPMQGWYYWIIPFFIYFYVKNEKFSKLPLNLLIISYFIYFGLIPNSDYFTIFSVLSPAIANWPNAYTLLTNYGLNANLISDISLSLLQATLLANVFWLYRRGVEESKKQKLYNMPYLVGISGDSGSGKSTLATLLANLFGKKHVALVAGDAMHKWERGHTMWQKFTHLDPRANQLHDDLEHAVALQSGEDIYRRHYDHHNGTFTIPEKLESKTLAIFEGLHSFFLTDMQKALDLKIFILPEESLRTHWKLKRDMVERGYTKEKVIAQLQAREKDAKEYITVQEKYADIIFSLKSLTSLTDDIIGTDFEPAVYLEIKCNNTIYLEPLLRGLSTYVNIEHTFTDQHQLLSITGNVSSIIIEHLSYTLTPELYDVINDTPQWEKDHSGIMQLFISYYILQSLNYRNEQFKIPKVLPTNNSLLTEIASASQTIGEHVSYVQGGGGNVSIKLDANTMAVKASGLRLEEIKENTGLVGVDYVSIRRFFNTPLPIIDLQSVLSEYEVTVEASRTKVFGLPETSLRPSIETGFHAILDNVVIHTHSIYVNILTCSKEGKLILQALFPHSAYIPYFTPGVPLTFAISRALKEAPYKTFFLENHGLVVSGKTVAEAMSMHRDVNLKIKKWLKHSSDFPDTTVTTEINGKLVSQHPSLTKFIQANASLLPSFKETILFPDQVIYCQKFGFVGDNKPIIVDEKSGLITYNVSYKEAQAFVETLTAWLYILSHIKRQNLTAITLPSTEGELIASLDSEKYRQRLLR